MDDGGDANHTPVLLPPRRRAPLLAGAGTLLGATAVFVVLLLLVTGPQAPLGALDADADTTLNRFVADHPLVVSGLQVVTHLGGGDVSWLLIPLLAVVLLIRRQRGLVLYVSVTGLGLAILNPGVKALIGRARPTVPEPIATAAGSSFPSGHAMGSLTTYGLVLLVVVPVVSPRTRRWLLVVVGLLVLAVGFSRVALGVHYATDVVAGWAVATGWLTTTTLLYRWRVHAQPGQPPSLRAGPDPDAAAALRPAPLARRPVPHPLRTAASLAGALAAILAVLAVVGRLLTGVLADTAVVRFDRWAVHALAGQRSPVGIAISSFVSELGSARVIISIAVIAVVLAVAVRRRWWPSIFLLVALGGELVVYLATSRLLVSRTRPAVPRLNPDLPAAASFPSGHVAAAVALYGGIAVLVWHATTSWWRWLALSVAVVAPTLVAVARVYRGEHYPTDVAASALAMGVWLSALARFLLSAPGAEPHVRNTTARRGPPETD